MRGANFFDLNHRHGYLNIGLGYFNHDLGYLNHVLGNFNPVLRYFAFLLLQYGSFRLQIRLNLLHNADVFTTGIDHFHRHCKGEGAAHVFTIRNNVDSSSILLDQVLADNEAKADSLGVAILLVFQSAVLSEEHRDLISFDSNPSVSDLNSDLLPVEHVARLNRDLSVLGELESVFEQVDEYLLESTHITG